MAKLTKESNQLNLTVVALVALVAIVGLVALVLNAASLATMSENFATGVELAEAQEELPVYEDSGLPTEQVVLDQESPESEPLDS